MRRWLIAGGNICPYKIPQFLPRRDFETYHIQPKYHRAFNLTSCLLSPNDDTPALVPDLRLRCPYLVSRAVTRVDPLGQLCLL